VVRGGGYVKRQKKSKPKAASASRASAEKRDMQKIRNSARALAADPRSFIGRIDPRLHQTAVDGVGALAELTGLDPVEVLRRVAKVPPKRGRKRDLETAARVQLAAECKAKGMSQGQMAPRLYPGVEKEVARKRTQNLLTRCKGEIEAEIARRQNSSPTVTS
jgi:hypothetical protein